MNPDAAIQQLIDGNADAAVAAFGTNPSYSEWLVGGPLRKLEATGRKVNYIGVDQAAIDKVNKEWNTGFLTVNVPAKTLPLQEQPFMSALNRGYIAANPALPDDVAYALVKAVAKYGPEMAQAQCALEALVTGNDAARIVRRQRASGREEGVRRAWLVGSAQEISRGHFRQNSIRQRRDRRGSRQCRSPSGFPLRLI